MMPCRSIPEVVPPPGRLAFSCRYSRPDCGSSAVALSIRITLSDWAAAASAFVSGAGLPDGESDGESDGKSDGKSAARSACGVVRPQNLAMWCEDEMPASRIHGAGLPQPPSPSGSIGTPCPMPVTL